MTTEAFYCPACKGPEGHSKLVIGEFESFGCYYPATCRSCNETYEIPADRIEEDR